MKKGKKTQKTREEEITEVLIDLEKDLFHFKLSIDKKDKTIKEYIHLLTLAKKEYQKLFEENKRLKEALLKTKKKYREGKKYIYKESI